MQNSTRFPHLLKSDMLAGLETDFKTAFLNACQMRVHRQPTVIFEQGKPASEVMILAHGHVDVTYLGKGGIEMFIIRLLPGTALSEMEVISDLPCLATCKTSKNATLLLCPRAQLDLALQQPAFLKNMVSSYYWRLSYVNWSKYMAQFSSVVERLRGYLYVLSEQTQTIQDTQSYLANMIGCSRQTINRELAVLRKEGLIEKKGNEIIILNRAALGALVIE